MVFGSTQIIKEKARNILGELKKKVGEVAYNDQLDYIRTIEKAHNLLYNVGKVDQIQTQEVDRLIDLSPPTWKREVRSILWNKLTDEQKDKPLGPYVNWLRQQKENVVRLAESAELYGNEKNEIFHSRTTRKNENFHSRIIKKRMPHAI